MEVRAAVLGEGVGELEGVELDVGVAVGEAFYEGGDGLLGAGRGGGDEVADVEDEAPGLGGEVFIGRFACRGRSVLAACRKVVVVMWAGSVMCCRRRNVPTAVSN